MNLKATIKVNKEIMRLIVSKYPDIFPTGYSGPYFRYYKRLKKDVEEAERYNSFSDKKDHTYES